MNRRRKQITSVVVAGVMTIALLNPVQTWSDSFVGDVPVSEEPLVYGTTSPEAAVGSEEQNVASVVNEPVDNGTSTEGSSASVSNEGNETEPTSEAGQNTETQDSTSEQSDSSLGESGQDNTESNTDISTESGTESGTDVNPTPADESTADSSTTDITGTVTPSVTPDPSVTPSISVTPTVTGTVSPTPTPVKKTDYKLTIYYKYSGGGQASSTYVGKYKAGESYSISSPSVSGYVPDIGTVSGKMGPADSSVTVTYSPTAETIAKQQEYTLKINYISTNGNRVADIYYGTYHYGDAYSISSPSVSGYTAGIGAVSGTITGNVELTVTYTVNAAPVPTPRATYTVRTTNQAYNAASTYTQKLVNPELAGFAKISKKYALAKCDSFLNVREGKGYSNRIVGVLYPNNLCYIIEDKDSKWVYIESGTVRGFVDKQYLLTGTKANAYVKKQGESKLTLAKQIIAPANNTAFRYILKTVRDIPSSVSYRSASTTADRQAMISFSEQFLGNPYVWGGESLTEGCDCSGFTMLIYRQFGIELPRCSYEQAEVGTKIAAQDALPGDLLFYARDGAVYHVLMYIGNGQAINASSSTTGIIISNVDYDKTCWGVRVIEDAPSSSTQASSLVEIGQRAYNGDESAQQQIIEALGTATQEEWTQYGMLPSVVIAQVIQESGWLSFSGAANGGIQPEDNNILGMNEELLNDQWESPWTGTAAMRNVPQWDGTKDVYGEESMRTYEDIEACLSDYAAFKTGIHPEIRNETDVDTVIDIGLEGYATDPTYEESIGNIIDKYDLTRYDTIAQMGTSPTDPTNYTQEELELIWAIVAQEDDTSYEGALAVISSAMNRADANYGGYGSTALEQLTADGQYCYSPKVSDPSLYQRRLGGNVDNFVIQAVSDCLTQGVRNNTYLNFRSSNRTGDYVQIGSNWYF